MCEQITINSLAAAITPQSLYLSVRHAIDTLLEDFNMSAQHVVAVDLKGGVSLRYNIGSSGLGIIAQEENTAGSKVIVRFIRQKDKTVVEVPANRVRFYEQCGEIKSAVSGGWMRINITPADGFGKLSEAICTDIRVFLLGYPSDFACCGLYEKCSAARKCIQENQDMSASCYYKKNLMQGRIFYSQN
ncbi:MAG: hypothetical protein PUF80_00630 [Firmicutes bacterium]|nr:hypothetical protein [Bacillota bacterium]